MAGTTSDLGYSMTIKSNKLNPSKIKKSSNGGDSTFERVGSRVMSGDSTNKNDHTTTGDLRELNFDLTKQSKTFKGFQEADKTKSSKNVSFANESYGNPMMQKSLEERKTTDYVTFEPPSGTLKSKDLANTADKVITDKMMILR
jgi:hypothetical protein